MLVLKTGTLAKADIKGVDASETKGNGGVTLSGSMTRQVSEPSHLTVQLAHGT
jgi:hypothetical protein